MPRFKEIQSKADLDRKLSPFEKRRVSKLEDKVLASQRENLKTFGSMIEQPSASCNQDLISAKNHGKSMSFFNEKLETSSTRRSIHQGNPVN